MAERGSGRRKQKPASASSHPPLSELTDPPASASSAGTSDRKGAASTLPGPLSGPAPKGKEKKRKRARDSVESDSPTSGPDEVIKKRKGERAEAKRREDEQNKRKAGEVDASAQAAPNGQEEGAANGRKSRKSRNRRRKSGPAGHLARDLASPSQTPSMGTVQSLTSGGDAMETVLAIDDAGQAGLSPSQDITTATALAADEDMARYLKMSAPSTSTHRHVDSLDHARPTRKTASAKATHPQPINTSPGKSAAELVVLKTQLEAAKIEAERQAEALRLRIEELEGKVQTGKEEGDAKDEIIKTNERVRDLLKDAVSCGVCFETLNDPHTLSCGHVACRTCLVSWFRTPGAYVHTVPDPIPEDMDLSYWTKVCHVCRTYIVNRPIRMYHLQSILEPLGIDTHIPMALQTAKAGSAEDPWRNSFPEDKDSYRMRDDGDNVFRCPACLGEIDEGLCSHCGAQFSEEEDVEDFESGEDDEVHDEDDGDDDGGSQFHDSGSDTTLRNQRGEGDNSDGSGRRSGRQNRAARFGRHRGDATPDDEGDGSEDSDIVVLEHPRRRRIGNNRPTSPRSVTRGNRRLGRQSGTDEAAISDDAMSQSSDTDADVLPARPRRPSPRRNRRVEQRSPRRRRHRSGSLDLPQGVANLLDIFADDSGDDMTHDEGDDPVGETGDYPDLPSTGEEMSSDEERRRGEGSDESAYEGSFIDDDDLSGSDVDGGVGGDDGSGQSGSDGEDDLEDSVIARAPRRAGSRIGGARARERSSGDAEDGESEGGSEVGLEEMRQRRLRVYERLGR